jgi:hypothetical protein
MKKLIVLITLFTTVYATNVNAQTAGVQQNAAQQSSGENDAMAARIKQTKALLVEKAKITDEQAEKVMQANMEVRKSLGDMSKLSDEERKAKIAGLTEERIKRYKEIPLTDEQIQAVNDAFADMKKQAEGRRAGSK